MELVVRPESTLAGRSASDILLRTRYGVNLLAVSREGMRSKSRLRTFRIRSGDLASAIMVASVAAAAFAVLPTTVACAAGVLASMALSTVPPRAVYGAVDWPVIVLLGALIPVAGAMETTGTADLIARYLLDGAAQGNAIIGMALILIVTMLPNSTATRICSFSTVCG